MQLPRMTTQRWMVAVAIAGLVCVLELRRRSFASRAAYHESRMVARMFPRYRKYLGARSPPRTFGPSYTTAGTPTSGSTSTTIAPGRS